ncbi:MAG: hypothetical protein Q9182_005559 [Xanthomendoza sp. 2 TL-2023]
MTHLDLLSSEQAHALFDILTSHVTLAEIESLKHSKTIATFGPPLQPSITDQASTPLLRILLQSFINHLPGFKNVTSQFWTDSIYRLGTALDDANLSQSYDKGSVGIRRTLSTASASIIESVARGRLGGYPKRPLKEDPTYDRASPDDVVKGWDDFLQRIIYGDLLDKMFVKASETDNLSDHEPVVQAAHQYALTIFASLLHHNLIVSPRGQSMVSLLNRVHRLTPYFLVKQTLRIGNAASMLNGMTQLVLAKMNISTLTSWFGGQASDSGMNLLQQYESQHGQGGFRLLTYSRIISQVLTADTVELRKRAKQIEQSKESLEKSQIDRLCKYVSEPAEEQQRIRNESESRSISIAAAIIGPDRIIPPLTESSHKLALEYVSIKLAIRDREKLIEVLCHHSPDLVTKSIRELVTVYDPVIRALHKAVDLTAGVTDLQNFIDDLVALSLIDKTKPANPPTVQNFCRLLEKHQKSSHVFIHQALKNGKELSQWYHEYASHAIEQYKQLGDMDEAANGKTAAGDFTRCLNDLISKLSKDQRQQVLEQLDQHATFLDSLAHQSKARMDKAVRASMEPKSSNNEVEGNPGMFLLKWQRFIDQTAITPGPTSIQPRSGKSESVVKATAVDVDGEKSVMTDQVVATGAPSSDSPKVDIVIRLLEPGFRDELQKLVAVKKG